MEEHGQSLIELMVVVIIAFLIPIALERFEIRALALVAAEIIAGLVLGKSGLNVIGAGRCRAVRPRYPRTRHVGRSGEHSTSGRS